MFMAHYEPLSTTGYSSTRKYGETQSDKERLREFHTFLIKVCHSLPDYNLNPQALRLVSSPTFHQNQLNPFSSPPSNLLSQETPPNHQDD
jgi:hypothetical protein